MIGKILSLHVQTPLHAGAGTALGTVDLPIQRERYTQWPIIASTSLKGILRDACRERLAEREDLLSLEQSISSEGSQDDEDPTHSAERTPNARRKRADSTMNLNLLFGPPTAGAGEFGGALSLTDARMLLFPIRSAWGVHAWVTCPRALERLQRDARLIGAQADWDIPEISEGQCLCQLNSRCLQNGVAILEDIDFERVKAADDDATNVTAIGEWISERFFREDFQEAASRFLRHFIVISDDEFTHFVKTSTEVSARIALDYQTKTVKKGALFYQECLPSESLLYSLLLAHPARTGKTTLSSQEVFKQLDELYTPDVLQIGGDASTGKGICAVRFAEVELQA